ncbi:MAG: GHMP kinase [Spirochaetaceae bacterium]|nr:GHMP kinase [Spirochaetaceae bacterium]
MKRVTAFSPGHVTGLFYMKDLEPDPLYCGSLGSGFSLVKGTSTTVNKNKTSKDHIITINSLKKEAPVSRKIVELFFEKTEITPECLKIEHEIETPQGSGFGSSGAGALSLVFALNRLYSDPLSALQASQVAHCAEVICKTGLGTVMGETLGGIKILIKPGAPGIGETISIPYPEGLCAMFAVYGPLSTREALSDPLLREKITISGKKYHSLIKKEPGFENFIKYSREFAESTGMIPQSVRTVIDGFDKKGVNSSMLMFGEGTFTIVPETDIEKVKKIAEKIISEIKSNRKPLLFFSNIARGGVNIVSEDA